MYTIVESHGKAYKVADGTFYDPETPNEVVRAIETARTSGDRVRFWYGKDGKNWAEEYDVIGTISRSMGPVKIPLLIHKPSDSGGGGILTDCIVKMVSTKSKRVLYQSPTFRQSEYKIIPSDLPEYTEAVTIDGELNARFKKAGQAARYVAFMTGERFTK